MSITQILEKSTNARSNEKQALSLGVDLPLELYPFSVRKYKNAHFFLGFHKKEKSLFILFEQEDTVLAGRFEGLVLQEALEGGWNLKTCPLNHPNAETLRSLFSHTRTRILGTGNSIGMGDRLGLANPGHIRAVKGSGMRVVLAQQSIRELTRTKRKPENVMDAATWAVFQEDFEEGFGSDADHLKTAPDVDLLTAAGFTMFTIDPGEHVNNAADKLDAETIKAEIRKLSWDPLEDSYADCTRRYTGKPFMLPGDFKLAPTEEQVSRALIKYGRAIAHIFFLYKHLSDKKSGNPFELEASVDETESVTSPFEHFFIARELKRLHVRFVSLAPRFIGDFEKGIDYKGDLKKFEEEYKKHVSISLELGPYKISLHSGSDKFSLYDIIGKLKNGTVHVKTAGTSWLVALQTISMVNPDLFRNILDFAKERYPTDRASYFVSGRVEDVPPAKTLKDSQLPELFNQNSARQILHVTFGSVLAAEKENGGSRFKDAIFQSLKENESKHYQNLENHLKKHIQPFIR